MTALCQPARGSVSQPKERAPAKSVDCHFHIFGPDARYPYAQNRGYTPPEALVPQYKAMIATLGIERMVIVHSSVYGTNNRCSLDSMAKLGRGCCFMVAVVDERVGEAELKRLDRLGVRGVRFNLFNVGGPSRDALDIVARRIAPLGWHLQVYVARAQLPELAPVLAALPLPVVIDRMGQIMTGWGLDHPGARRVAPADRWRPRQGQALRLSQLERRISLRRRRPAGARAHRRRGGALSGDTDWPHPNFAGTIADDSELLDLLSEWSPALRHKILVENPAALCGFPL